MASASQAQSNNAAASSAWSEILPVIAVLGTFSVYATWRAFEGAYFSALLAEARDSLRSACGALMARAEAERAFS